MSQLNSEDRKTPSAINKDVENKMLSWKRDMKPKRYTRNRKKRLQRTWSLKQETGNRKQEAHSGGRRYDRVGILKCPMKEEEHDEMLQDEAPPPGTRFLIGRQLPVNIHAGRRDEFDLQVDTTYIPGTPAGDDVIACANRTSVAGILLFLRL